MFVSICWCLVPGAYVPKGHVKRGGSAADGVGASYVVTRQHSHIAISACANHCF